MYHLDGGIRRFFFCPLFFLEETIFLLCFLRSLSHSLLLSSIESSKYLWRLNSWNKYKLLKTLDSLREKHVYKTRKTVRTALPLMMINSNLIGTLINNKLKLLQKNAINGQSKMVLPRNKHVLCYQKVLPYHAYIWPAIYVPGYTIPSYEWVQKLRKNTAKLLSLLGTKF